MVRYAARMAVASLDIRRDLRFLGTVSRYLRLALVSFVCAGVSFAGCSRDSTIYFEESHWKVVKRLENTRVVFGSYSFSPDGNSLAAACLDGKIRLYATATGDLLAEWESKHQRVSKATFSPGGTLLATVGTGPPVNVWNVEARTLVAAGDELDGHIVSVSWSSDSTRMVAIDHASRFGEIIVLDALNLRKLAVLQGHTDMVQGVEFSPAGDIIASISYDETVRIWDATTYAAVRTLHGHPDRILCMSFAPSGRFLVTSGLKGGLFEAGESLVVWDCTSWRPQHPLRNRYGTFGLLWSPDDSQLMTLDGYYVQWWDVTSGRLLGHRDRAAYPMDMALYSPDGRWAVNNETVRYVVTDTLVFWRYIPSKPR